MRTFKPGDTLEIVPEKWKDRMPKGTSVKVLPEEITGTDEENLVRIKWVSGPFANVEQTIYNQDNAFRVIDIPLPVKYDTYEGGN